MKDGGKGRKQLLQELTALQLNNAELQSLLVERERAIKEVREAENTLRLQAEKFKSILDGAGDDIALTDADGTIIYENDRVEDLFGYTREESLGKNIYNFPILRDSSFEDTRRIFNELVKGQNRQFYEIEFIRKDGSTVFVEVNQKPFIKQGKIEGHVSVIRDITERKKYEEKLRELYEQERRLREQIEAEMKRRIDYTRALAHELKTPLTPVLASVDTLLSDLQDQHLLSLAQNISRGAHTLDSRINELLDLARGEIGMLKLKPEQIDVLPMLQEITHNTMPLASELGLSFLVDLPQCLPTVQADTVRLQQVVINLLDNAFKFTSRGGQIMLSARTEGDSLIVEVRDSGSGMSKEQQERVFEPYHRLETSKNHTDGLGLGLALCKTLVELHGGRIWVKSSPGAGSTFGFALPTSDVRRKVTTKEEGKLWKILLIEDNKEIVDSISLILQKDWLEAELITARTGEQGLELVEKADPDIVILDLGLPDIDGFEVLKQVRLFSSVPVVVVTVREAEEYLARALDLGANDYITKPFGKKELLARLKAQLRGGNPADGETSIISGQLCLVPKTCQLIFGRKVIGLTVIECLILQKLMRKTGHIVTHSDLAEAIWGEDSPGAIVSLRTYIHRLRQKIESDPNNPKLILTKAGIGYSLVKQPQNIIATISNKLHNSLSLSGLI
jgi:two-component system, OmpR family, aerobic respiration control sensor histidine kinase ArcB